MRVVARETTFKPSAHAAILLGEIDLDDHTILRKKGIFEPSQSLCDKENLLAFSNFSDFQENAIPARIVNPGENRTRYKASTQRTFTILEADTLAQKNVVTEQKQKQSALTRYELRNLLHRAKPVLNEKSHAKFVQLVHEF